ncbi:hypothetical protein GALMADRAFT_1362442, partial [Galerina marginata CBS 339.88]
ANLCSKDPSYLISVDKFNHWLATTDADITFIGEPINPLTPRAALDIMVTYCTARSADVCGGSCIVYNGGPACLAAPGTNCLAATANVGFCDRENCGNSCNSLDSCGTPLTNGFCFTPGTQGINVPAA